MTERDEALTRHARKFLSAAIRVLERDRVLPRPTFQPYIEVGRDYERCDQAAVEVRVARDGRLVRSERSRRSGAGRGRHHDVRGSVSEVCPADTCAGAES